jgi:hypothetical protein
MNFGSNVVYFERYVYWDLTSQGPSSWPAPRRLWPQPALRIQVVPPRQLRLPAEEAARFGTVDARGVRAGQGGAQRDGRAAPVPHFLRKAAPSFRVARGQVNDLRHAR